MKKFFRYFFQTATEKSSASSIRDPEGSEKPETAPTRRNLRSEIYETSTTSWMTEVMDSENKYLKYDYRRVSLKVPNVKFDFDARFLTDTSKPIIENGQALEETKTILT